MDGNCHTDFFAGGIVQTDIVAFLNAYKSIGCDPVTTIDENYNPCQVYQQVI